MTELRERVQLSHVSRSFGQTLAVDDVSLDIKEGELLGLLGINVPRYEQKTLSIT